MKRKRIIGRLIIFSFILGLPGCRQSQDKKVNEESVILSSETDNDTEQRGKTAPTVGSGFRAPKGSHVDKNGNIVDPEGNTFNKKGEWQIPEGGRVDSQGRIYDKNGKLMGGGAVVGSCG